MQVTVKGGDHHIQRTLRQAAVFYAGCLMDPRMVRNLVLDIDIHCKYHSQGDCVDDEGTRNPRWFTINLRKQALPEMLKTLAHEMVHVKQHALNEFRGSPAGLIPARGQKKYAAMWRGQLWVPKGREDPYFDSPWEIEAYGREVGLYHRYVCEHMPDFVDKYI
jgi:hypothetical protein